jgi:hypothetical protein
MTPAEEIKRATAEAEYLESVRLVGEIDRCLLELTTLKIGDVFVMQRLQHVEDRARHLRDEYGEQYSGLGSLPNAGTPGPAAREF